MSADTLYVFGDQSLDLSPSVQQLTRRCREIAALQDFLRVAIDNVKSALLATPVHLRAHVPFFDSPLQLAESIENSPKFTPLVSSLLTIVHLGDFIVHLSSNPCALDDPETYPAFVGLCTGSLSAAAIASCRNLAELLELAPYIVTLSFHVGLQALRRSQNLDVSVGNWATVVKDVKHAEVEDALESFNQTLDDYFHRRAYISAVSDSSITISGPPSITQRLFSASSTLSRARRVQLPIYSAFHARHLIPVPLSRIFDHVHVHVLRRHLRHLVLSPYSGTRYKSNRLDQVLYEIVGEILQQPINWQNVTKELPMVLSTSATVTAMGPFVAMGSLSRWTHQKESSTESKEGSASCDFSQEVPGGIAIVGMSIRAPGSETLEGFWEILKEGKDLHQKIPADRFDHNSCGHRGTRNTGVTTPPYGVFLDRPGHFDPRFFNMSPREAIQTDPQQRLLLLTVYEALENAGYRPNRTPSYNTKRIGSFIGQTGDDYREYNASQDVDTYFITGNIRAFGPGRLNYYFGWEGPSYSVDTACSSSGAAIQLACSTLLSRECDAAVCGGANLLTSPDLFMGLARGGFLSRTGQCKTFDQNADGYVRGEACGVLILKRLEDAVLDQDNILAVIRGATTNHSAEAVSITHPHQNTQERLFRSVLDKAGVCPHEVDLAEIHGTGTQAGDNVESRSVTNVLSQGRSSQNPLILSTVKPNIGHGEAASGVTSIIKAVLMMQKNTIPPHIGIKTCINGQLPPFEQLHAHVCEAATPFFPRAGTNSKRRILVNNFDAAGGNTSMLIEDPPLSPSIGQDKRCQRIVTLSSKSATSLKNSICNLHKWLKCNAHTRIEDVAYTTTARRVHYAYRKAYNVTSLEELTSRLENEDLSKPVPRVSASPRTVFCFTGQGSQYLSMAADLYKMHPSFRDSIDDYARLCDAYGFPSFMAILDGDLAALNCPVRIQLSLVAVELALAYLWRSWGIQPAAVVGHSLGEYAALCYAGVISIEDCFYLVGKRAQLISSMCTPNVFAMLAVQAPTSFIRGQIDDLSFQNIEFACFNSTSSTVLSGRVDQIELLEKSLRSRRIVTKTLSTQYAFHSSQMDAILDEFENVTSRVNFAKPLIPIASTSLGTTVTHEGVFDARYLRSQTRNPVVFQDAIQALLNTSHVDEKSVWIEIGPSPACTNMIRDTVSRTGVILPSLQRGRDWQALSSSTAAAYSAGVDVDWTEFHRPFEGCLKLVQLPNYSFDLKNYWIEGRHIRKLETPQQHRKRENSHTTKQHTFSPTVCLHRIEKDESNADMIKLTFVSDASNPHFNKVLCGHLVDGVALCSSSIYAEMAFTAASHIRDMLELNQEIGMEIENMKVSKPLVITLNSTQQVIRVTALSQLSRHEVEIQFSSQEGAIMQDHATCNVRFTTRTQSTMQTTENARTIRSKMDHLHEACSAGRAHKILRPIVYKLFKNFVDYGQEYQGLEEVILDTSNLEATAQVVFRGTDDGFTYNPHWIDSIAHLSGFVLNGSEFTPDDSVFISHGWKNCKILGSLSPKKKYQSYVCMRPNARQTILTGDVHLFEGDEMVAVFEGLRFQQVKRSLLDNILPCVKKLPSGKRPSVCEPEVSLDPTGSILVASEEEHAPLSHAVACAAAFDLILEVIAGEVGIESSELNEETDLHDLGIDSLMTASILAILGAEFGLSIPASVFVECHSIQDLRTHFAANLNPSAISIRQESDDLVLEEKEGSRATKMRISEGSVDFPQILKVIAEELGVAASELEDDVLFADVGVDSLLTISILSRLGELTQQQIPASFFIQCPSVAELRSYLQPPTRNGNLEIACLDYNDHGCARQEALNSSAKPMTESKDHFVRHNPEDKDIAMKTIHNIIADEIRISPTDIDENVSLVELGVDSLLSLSISTRIREQLGLNLASTFSSEYPTLSAIRRTLLNPSSPWHIVNVNSTPDRPPSVPLWRPITTDPVPQKPDTGVWGASSILLQTSTDRTEPCLFLIPDGSGSPMTYLELPHLGHHGAVYGLNSPFLGCPDEFKMSLHEMVTLYVDEMQRIQPHGPYHIGGWSIGGICAFEAASQLIRTRGQEVSSLVLIDAPCPTVIPPLPVKDIDLLQSIGVFETLRPSSKRRGGVPVPSAALGLRDNIREHFSGAINALEQYRAQPIDESQAPRSVTILWARHGVWETLGQEVGTLKAGASKTSQHPTTSWLMDARTDYETCGWDKLLPGSNFTCHSVEGDHFSMMRKPGVQEIGAKITLSRASSRTVGKPSSEFAS